MALCEYETCAGVYVQMCPFSAVKGSRFCAAHLAMWQGRSNEQPKTKRRPSADVLPWSEADAKVFDAHHPRK